MPRDLRRAQLRLRRPRLRRWLRLLLRRAGLQLGTQRGEVHEGRAAPLLGLPLQLVDLARDAAGEGDGAGQGEHDEGGELAADEEQQEEERHAPDVVFPARAEQLRRAGQGDGVHFGRGGHGGGVGCRGGMVGRQAGARGQVVKQPRVGVYVLQARLVECEVRLAGREEERYGRLCRLADGQLEGRRSGRLGRVGSAAGDNRSGGYQRRRAWGFARARDRLRFSCCRGKSKLEENMRLPRLTISGSQIDCGSF